MFRVNLKYRYRLEYRKPKYRNLLEYRKKVLRRSFLFTKLAIKARFARVRAARGGSQAYQGSSIDPTHQSQPLDPPSEARFLILFPPIQLLIKDLQAKRNKFQFR